MNSPIMNQARDQFSPARLGEVLAGMPPMAEYRVAFSGGADSLALLHALCGLRASLAPARVSAVHVHHGLHADAHLWAAECRRACDRLEVPLELQQVDARCRRGESPEAAARRVRYAAFSELLADGGAVLTAHHQRDQAETLLLQLLRGAGPAGLAAMPARAPLGGGWLLRPLLAVPPASLQAYLVRQGLAWIEDPGNADLRMDRNYLRHEILPRLESRWPGACRTLSRAAGHQADGAVIARALARTDLARCRGPVAQTLSAAAVEALPAARARNLIRGWLAERGLPTAGAVHVEEILSELIEARGDAAPLVSWPGAQVRRHRGALYAGAPMPPHDPGRVIPWTPGTALALDHGSIQASCAEGRGLSAQRCADARVEVRYRRGGERFQPAGRRHGTALKKLLQGGGVPPWLRERVPLVYVDDELAAVAGLWVASGFSAGGGQRGWLISWSELPGAAG